MDATAAEIDSFSDYCWSPVALPASIVNGHYCSSPSSIAYNRGYGLNVTCEPSRLRRLPYCILRSERVVPRLDSDGLGLYRSVDLWIGADSFPEASVGQDLAFQEVDILEDFHPDSI